MKDVYTAILHHFHVPTVENCLQESMKWSVIFVFTLDQSHSHVDTAQKSLKRFTNWRHICWNHTMKALGSHVTFVRRNSASRVPLSDTCSDMKVLSRNAVCLWWMSKAYLYSIWTEKAPAYALRPVRRATVYVRRAVNVAEKSCICYLHRVTSGDVHWLLAMHCLGFWLTDSCGAYHTFWTLDFYIFADIC